MEWSSGVCGDGALRAVGNGESRVWKKGSDVHERLRQFGRGESCKVRKGADFEIAACLCRRIEGYAFGASMTFVFLGIYLVVSSFVQSHQRLVALPNLIIQRRCSR